MTRRLSAWIAGALLLVALLAPLLCNDVPLVARAGGELWFPALRSYAGDAGLAPDGRTWKAWWVHLDEDDADWAVMPPWPWGPGEVRADHIVATPSLDHPLGNDDTGRDVLARLVHGAWTAVRVAVGAVAIALVLGLPLGGLAGLCGGFVDFAVLRLIELFVCFPALIAVLAAAAFFGGSLGAVVVVLGLVFWVPIARVVRGELLSLREREFVQAARGLGIGSLRLLFVHVLPCVWGPIGVTVAFLAAAAIVVESTYTFLGLGLGLDTVSWGSMLRQGKAHAHAGAWHLWVFPGLAIAVTVLALHGLGESGTRSAGGARTVR